MYFTCYIIEACYDVPVVGSPLRPSPAAGYCCGYPGHVIPTLELHISIRNEEKKKKRRLDRRTRRKIASSQ